MAKITWFGHAAFKIEVAGKIILVDPWLNGNPTSSIKASDVTSADVVYVTHDHSDHLGDAFDICKRTGATFVSVVELATIARNEDVMKTEGANIGGTVNVDGVRLTIVQAFHTAGRGVPTGLIIEGEGKAVYHAGDTGIFSDMRLLGELYKFDVALLPIGGYYTMGAKQASEAAKLLNPKAIVPMHYKTFSVLAQSAEEFVRYVRTKAPQIKVIVLKPGETHEF